VSFRGPDLSVPPHVSSVFCLAFAGRLVFSRLRECLDDFPAFAVGGV
jgi:hypothetical protein